MPAEYEWIAGDETPSMNPAATGTFTMAIAQTGGGRDLTQFRGGARSILGRDQRLEGLRPIRVTAELIREPIKDVVDRVTADPLVERGEGRLEGTGLDVTLIAVDEGMGHFVEQTERHDLAGVGGRWAAATFVQPGSETARRRDLVDLQLALVTEMALVQVVPSPR